MEKIKEYLDQFKALSLKEKIFLLFPYILAILVCCRIAFELNRNKNVELNRNKNVIVFGKPGYGKTVSFVKPMLFEELEENNQKQDAPEKERKQPSRDEAR